MANIELYLKSDLQNKTHTLHIEEPTKPIKVDRKFIYKGEKYYINHTLANQLISLVYNLRKDWDFVILVTGDRKVRVGKSVLAMSICAFLSVTIKALRQTNYDSYGVANIFFDNKLVVSESQKRPPFSIIHYDEGREGLAANKAMKSFQQDLVDFFTECGQLNHIFVIVCPDFFELKEEMAVARAEVLINVYRKETRLMKVVKGIEKVIPSLKGVELPIVRFDRGYFEFYDRFRKALLYDMAKSKRRKSYNLVKPIFTGSFTNQYPEDEVIYKGLKKASLQRFSERHKEQAKSNLEVKNEKLRDNLIWKRHLEDKTTKFMQKELDSIGLKISLDRIREIIKKKKDNEAKILEELSLKKDNTPPTPPTPPLVLETRTIAGGYTNIPSKRGVISDI